jgi:diacylglycerol kinase (CTP)
VSEVRGGEDEEHNRQQSAVLSLRRELARKALHLLSAVIPVGYAVGASREVVLWTLCAALGVAASVEVARTRSRYARSLFESSVGILLREHERDALSGATWLVTALFVTALLFPKDVAIAAMSAVCMGDAVAAVVGRAFSRSTYHERKSFAGSVACLAVTAVAARTIGEFSWPDALLAGVLAAAAERPRRPLDDNFRIALAVGCGILLWRMGFS